MDVNDGVLMYALNASLLQRPSLCISWSERPSDDTASVAAPMRNECDLYWCWLLFILAALMHLLSCVWKKCLVMGDPDWFWNNAPVLGHACFK